MKEWVETKDGKIVEVVRVHDDYIIAREIDESGTKLKYGETVTLAPEDIVDDGTEDDLTVIFKNMDECVNDFFDKAEKMFEEERDFYGT